MKQIDGHEIAGLGRDPDAVEAFYLEHRAAVRAFLARRISDPHEVADLTAEIFMTVIESAHRYRPEHGPPAAWLMGIARNKVMNARRRRARRLHAESRLIGRRLLDDDATARIEERIESERLTRALYEALTTLPRRDRRLMELVAIDGLTVADAADQLGMKPGTARVRLHRSRARLRDHLGDQSLLVTDDEPLSPLVIQEATA